MELRDLGDLVIYLGAVAVALTGLGVLLRVVAVRPLKRWMVEQVRPTAEQVVPNGGSQESTRHLIEQTAEQVTAVHRRMDKLDETAAQNRQLAIEALSIARDTGTRLDRHLTDHGGHH